MRISSIYAEEVRHNLKPYFPNWEPGRPVKLGDFGIMDGDVFTYLGNIETAFGITWSERTDPHGDHKNFSSKGKSEVKFSGSGSGPVSGVPIKAKLEVNFTSEHAAFFNAIDCRYTMIENKVRFGRDIMNLYRQPGSGWERRFVIITDLVVAGRTTIAVSGSRNSSIVFEADASVKQINLADASLSLSIASSKDIGYQLVADTGLCLLFGLCKIQNRFLGTGSDFKPLGFAASPFEVKSLMFPDSIPPKPTGDVGASAAGGEEDDDSYFGQLM